MSIENRLYRVAGVTRDKQNEVKVRYSGEDLEERIKLYKYLGAKYVHFIELPKPMNKIDACKFMVGHKDFSGVDVQAAIQLELVKKEALVAPKVPQKRGPKPKAKVAVAKPAKVKQASPKAKAVKAVKTVAPAAAAADIGEVVDAPEVDPYADVDDFDIRQFEQMAAEQA